MERLRVSNIQRFSVHDGEGIRTTVFLSGCPLRCAWCCNPETWDPAPRKGSYPEGAAGLLGRVMSVDEILAELRRDGIFHRLSGGGVTWSGGEPFFFPSGLRALVEACSGLGLRQAAETSGCFGWPSCSDIVERLDFVFIDLKHMDAGIHERVTGMGNEAILANAERIGASAAEVVARIPLVKGINDDEDNLAKTARFVLRVMRRRKIEVLPYHDLAARKYELLGLGARRGRFEVPSEEEVARAEAVLAREGAEVIRWR